MNREQIGSYIKGVRVERNLTQQEVAKKAGLLYQRLLEVEKNKTDFTIDRLLTILNAMDLQIQIVPKSPVEMFDVLAPVIPVKEPPKIKEKNGYDFSATVAANDEEGIRNIFKKQKPANEKDPVRSMFDYSSRKLRGNKRPVG
jgi:transcriptional regulator with XRE-family HTH domain